MFADLRLEPAPIGRAAAAGAAGPRGNAEHARHRGPRGQRCRTRSDPAGIEESRFNMTRAAQLLGVARAPRLYRMLQRNRIELASNSGSRAPNWPRGRTEGMANRAGPSARPSGTTVSVSRETLSQQRKRREKPSISHRVNNKTGRNQMLSPCRLQYLEDGTRIALSTGSACNRRDGADRCGIISRCPTPDDWR